MIYTVTFNPAIDHVVQMDSFRQGTVNRSCGEKMYFGGKGINVSAVLAELGVSSKALGFTAGFTGEAIENGVRAMGIESDFIRLAHGNSRINVKIKADAETEINGQGPDISENDLEKLFGKLKELGTGDILVLAGSVPKSVPDNVYERILAMTEGSGVRCIVDASGSLLVNVLKYRPFLIKPNLDELCDIFGKDIRSDDEVKEYALKLREMGAESVLVSMAGDGAVLIDENGVFHKCGVCRGIVRNSVGAGDSMLAGFIAGYAKGDPEYALKLGTACGGATAFSDGLAKKELIFELLAQLE